MNVVQTLKDLFIRHGSGWILWLLGALSIVSVAVCVERLLVFRARGGDLRRLAELCDRRLRVGDFDGAILDLKRTGTVAGEIACAGLRLAHLGPAAADKAMASATALERTRLEARLAYLGTLGNNAPFVGLFGTVIGIIQAFEELGHGASSAAQNAAASQASSAAVMSGIAEALIATAVGIGVALPAVAAYNYFQRRVTGLLSAADVLTNLVLAYLSGEPKVRPAEPPTMLAVPVVAAGEA